MYNNHLFSGSCGTQRVLGSTPVDLRQVTRTCEHTPFTHTVTARGNLESLSNVNVFELWEETGVPYRGDVALYPQKP